MSIWLGCLQAMHVASTTDVHLCKWKTWWHWNELNILHTKVLILEPKFSAKETC
jgi:hypothetical protein